MKKSLDNVFRFLEILMSILLLVMVGLMFMNVVLRFVLSTGFVWSEEITRLCFIYLVYLGTIGAYRDNRHLGVDTLIERVSPRMQRVFYVLIQVIVIWVMALLTKGSWDLAVQNLGDRWVATQIPRAFVFGIGVLTGVAIIALALNNLWRFYVDKLEVSDLLKVQDDEADESVPAGTID